MLEYNAHLLSKVVPDSEIEYREAIELAYTKTIQKLNKTKGVYNKKNINEMLRQIKIELIDINSTFAEQFKKDSLIILQKDAEALAIETALSLAFVGITDKIYKLPTGIIKGIIDTIDMEFYQVDAKGAVLVTKTTKDEMIGSIVGSQIKKANAVILGGIAVGETPEKIAKNLKPYMVDASVANTRSVITTLLAQGSQQCKNKFYDENKSVFDEYLYAAVIDNLTSNICRSLDGRRFEKRLPAYTPPLHHRCRSSLLRVPKGFNTGQRPVVLPNGEVEVIYDKNFTYRDAVKRFPALENKKFINTDEYLDSFNYYDVKK